MDKADEFLEYIASERFIHDNIVKEASFGIPSIVDTWRTKNTVDPFLIGWPADPVKADDGEVIDHYVSTELPLDRAQWGDLLTAFIQRIKPYALLLVEEKEDEVVAVVESKHGSKSWHFAIERHGPDRILKDPVEKVDVASIGILWRKKMPEA